MYSFGRGCKNLEAVAANWTEQHFIPSVFDSRCCVEEIAVLCQKSFAEPELGLWSILSTANVVKTFERSFVGQTTPSDSNCIHALFPSCVDKTNIQMFNKWHTLDNCNSFKTFLNVFNMIFLIIGKFAKFIPEFCHTVFMVSRFLSYHVFFW